MLSKQKAFALALVVVGLVLVPMVGGAEDDVQQTKEWWSKFSYKFIECAGFWDASAGVMMEGEKTDEAIFYRNAANGAETTYWNLLIMGGSAKEYAFEVAKDRRELERNTSTVMMRSGNLDHMNHLAERCVSEQMPVQVEIVQTLRSLVDSDTKDPDAWSDALHNAVIRGMEKMTMPGSGATNRATE